MAIDTDETRVRVIEAAGQVFAEKGFEAATVREICRRARANLAAVNYYFGDKRRLYVAAVQRAYSHRAEQVPLPVWAADATPEQRLGDFIHTLLERMIGVGGEPWEGELMLREVASPIDACEGIVRDYIRPHFEVLVHILEELLPRATEAERRLVGFSIVGQCLHYRVCDPVIRMLVPADEYSGLTPGHLAEHITALTLRGIEGLNKNSHRDAR